MDNSNEELQTVVHQTPWTAPELKEFAVGVATQFGGSSGGDGTFSS